MDNFELKDKYTVYDLEKIIALLRAPGGCPWDREQTHESIRRNFLEEAYEAVEAIDEKNPEHLQEELGDVLMQVVFHAGIEQDAGRFNLDDVADMTCKKLIRRHPHIFSDVKADTSEKVLENWDAIKMRERSQQSVTSTMGTVARSLPSMWRADKIIGKAVKAGFKWRTSDEALSKLSEEAGELQAAAASDGNIEEELGDTLFAAVHIAQIYGIDPEEALGKATDKFISRFEYVENAASLRGLKINELEYEDMLRLYSRSKAAEKGEKNE